MLSRHVGVLIAVMAELALFLLLAGNAIAGPARTIAPKEVVLWNFTGGDDGGDPIGGVVIDSAGTIYGTSVAGGHDDRGTVIALTRRHSIYRETTLWTFPILKGGSTPNGDLVVEPSGALLGTTVWGGDRGSDGTVFRISPTYGQTEQALWSIGRSGDGSVPDAGLIVDAAGNLFGVTEYGGTRGYGSVFELSPSGYKYTERVVWSFGGSGDGRYPGAALTLGSNGVIYGTTSGGGTGCFEGCGIVFNLTPMKSGYAENVLSYFRGPPDDAAAPDSRLIIDASGALYGTSYFGGPRACAEGCGAVFKLTPSRSGYTENAIWNFGGGSSGCYPSDVIAGPNGTLYGTTSQGNGGSYGGTLFELLPGVSSYTGRTLWKFGTGVDGTGPRGGLIADANGALYGVTYVGGLYGAGTVFKFVP